MSTDLGPFGKVWEGLQKRQDAHAKRLEWLWGLKTGDEVVLTCDGSDRLKTVERVKVVAVRVAGFAASDRLVFVEGHPRRGLKGGSWQRGGPNWLDLRIDPLEGQP